MCALIPLTLANLFLITSLLATFNPKNYIIVRSPSPAGDIVWPPCPSAALQQLLERCTRLEALEMPAAEQSSAPEPLLSAAEQGLSRPAGAWVLQQLPVSLTHLSLTECGSLQPTSLMHLGPLTALTKLSIRGLREVELVGQAGADPGDPWDGLLPAFLPSLTGLTRLAFHPPSLNDAAAALAPLAAVPSLARLELGGCGGGGGGDCAAAPLRLHEGAWRVLAAMPSLEQLLLGYCNAAVGGAVTSSSSFSSSTPPWVSGPRAGHTYPSAAAAAAGVGLAAAAAAAASLSSWGVRSSGGGGCGWIMGLGSRRSGGGGDGGWGSGCAALGSGLYGRNQYGNHTTPEDSPVRFGAVGASGGGGEGGDGWEMGSRALGGSAAVLSPASAWGSTGGTPGVGDAAREQYECREGGDPLARPEPGGGGDGGGADGDCVTHAEIRKAAVLLAGGAGACWNAAGAVSQDGEAGGQEFCGAGGKAPLPSAPPAASAVAAVEATEVDRIPATGLSTAVAGSAASPTESLPRELSMSYSRTVAGSPPAVVLGTEGIPRSHQTPATTAAATGVATPSDHTAAAVSVEPSCVGSSSAPSSRSSYCANASRWRVPNSATSARPASEGGYSWCSSCANNDDAVVTAAGAAAAAAAAAARCRDGERTRQLPLLGTTAGIDFAADGGGGGGVQEPAVTDAMDGGDSSAVGQPLVRSGSSGGGGADAAGAASAIGAGSGVTAALEGPPPRLLPPQRAPPLTGTDLVDNGGGAASITDVGTWSRTSAGQAEAAIVTAALTAAAAYRAATLEAAAARQGSPMGGADDGMLRQSTAAAVAAAWDVAAATATTAATAATTAHFVPAAATGGGGGDGSSAAPGEHSGLDAAAPADPDADVADLYGTSLLKSTTQQPCGGGGADVSSPKIFAPVFVAPSSASTVPSQGGGGVTCEDLPPAAATATATAAVAVVAAVTLASSGSVQNSAATSLKRAGSAAADLGGYDNRGSGGSGFSLAGGGGGGAGSVLNKLHAQANGGVISFSFLRRLSLLRIGDVDVVQLASCASLQAGLLSLSMSDCTDLGEGGMKGAPPQSISKLRRLEHLSLRGLKTTFDVIIGGWTTLRELRALELGLSPAAAAAALAAGVNAGMAASAAAIGTVTVAASAPPPPPLVHVGPTGDGTLRRFSTGCGDEVGLQQGGKGSSGGGGDGDGDGDGGNDGTVGGDMVEPGQRGGPPGVGDDGGYGGGGDGGTGTTDRTCGKWPPTPAVGAATELMELQAALCESAGAAAASGGSGGGNQLPSYQAYDDDLDATVAMVAAAGGFNSDVDYDDDAGGSTYAEAMYGSGSSRRSSDTGAAICSVDFVSGGEEDEEEDELCTSICLMGSDGGFDIPTATAAGGGGGSSGGGPGLAGLQVLLQLLPKVKELYLHNLPNLTPGTVEQVAHYTLLHTA
ncbi:hypothetical protein VOLCADRAFT_92032 [Volvox carteri f. nagariensis]|uniref:Uncharacterized protein n=1 Tax=Volvox carteri f. nagariensis TaxID=3068 RepID=D8TYX6_VOLCA|nr:uncharacterized protein VOLCADRAFT_92032 [Volvox carteri f. nagariensis]EFJ47293.1 hypothetical protein VOLCADRAFT_92032 [Volvox carteri f. nagariensis]|eukprot:XP_002951482.1 hypothetical protein VOLCADRAFT_92032 [Volvox carteri f. nagariensis]